MRDQRGLLGRHVDGLYAARRARHGDALRRPRSSDSRSRASEEGYSSPEIEGILNKQSGLLGVSGLTNDMRELLAEEAEHGDRRARLAIDLFAYRARKYVGSYLAAMNGADALIFAGGIGENASSVRARICEGLQWMGISLDPERNAAMIAGKEGRIDAAGSRVEVWVIPTAEE